MFVIPGPRRDARAPADARTAEFGPRALDYAYRLYLGHGITTVRDAGTGAGLEIMAEQRAQSDGQHARRAAAGALPALAAAAAPLGRRQHAGQGAGAWLAQFKELGADCVKVSKSPGHYPDVLAAIADEGKKLGMFTMVDLKVSESDALVASNAGVRSIEHWYGMPDAALKGSQNFPTDYNYWDELDRFRYAGLLWSEADKEPGEAAARSSTTMIRNGTNWNPTMSVYEDNRDVWRNVTMPVTRDADASQRSGRRPRLHGARRLQARVEDVGRDQLEDELSDLDEVGARIPPARRDAHRGKRRRRNRRHRPDPRAGAACRRPAFTRST